MRFFSIIFFLGSNCTEYEQVKQNPSLQDFPTFYWIRKKLILVQSHKETSEQKPFALEIMVVNLD